MANVSCRASRLKRVEQRLNKLQSLCSLAGLVNDDITEPRTANAAGDLTARAGSNSSDGAQALQRKIELVEAPSTRNPKAPTWTFPHGAFLPASSTIPPSWESKCCAGDDDIVSSVNEPRVAPHRGSQLPSREQYRQTLSIIFADEAETRLLSELDMSGPPGRIATLELPPMDTTFLVVRHLLQHLNTIVPLYDEHAAFHLLEVCYKQNTTPEPDAAAYVYSLVALAYACSGDISLHAHESVERTAWTFFARASRYLPQLMAGDESLFSTQATLSMVRNKGLQNALVWFGAHKTIRRFS